MYLLTHKGLTTLIGWSRSEKDSGPFESKMSFFVRVVHWKPKLNVIVAFIAWAEMSSNWLEPTPYR